LGNSAQDVLTFWREAGPKRWFRKDPAFDQQFRERFLATHEMAARGELAGWSATARGALALLVLLDQFPRNAFRGTPRMFATDAQALQLAREAVAAGFDRQVEAGLRNFFYLPFMHSEQLPDQDDALALTAALGAPQQRYAIEHRDIIRRFGRFPHRNAVLGRANTPEEDTFLAGGGFSG
jgi:uncharacterized protein (DUF924 family)